MRERVFYVINLDNRRIITLGLFLLALLSSFFFLGLSVGKRKGALEAYKNGIQQPEVAQKVEMSNIAPPAQPEQNKLEQGDNAFIKEEVISVEPVVQEKKQVETAAKLTTEEPVMETRETVRAEPEKKSVKKQSVKTASKPVEKYTIQVAAFTRESQAQSLVKKIKDNKKITSVTYIQPEGKYYMVRVGKYSNKDAIERLQSVVNSELHVKSMILKKSF